MEPQPSQGDQAESGPLHENGGGQGGREPIFNLPGVITVLIALLALIHLGREIFLSPAADRLVVLALAFIPASYSALASQLPIPISGLWSPVTYSLLHGDWLHLGMNALWLAAFGSPVARRFGSARFLALLAVTSMGGALFHYLWHPGAPIPMIGASGAVSGTMGAAARFAFSAPPGSGGRGFRADGRALTLAESFTNRSFLVFFAVWMALNYLFGSGILPVAGVDSIVAWQAHIGGFLTGVLAFPLFDPRARPRRGA